MLDVALNNDITLDHACGGNCACTTCHVWVKEGAENLSEMDDDEADRFDMAADLQLNSRLGCQAVITKPGKVVVEIRRGTGIMFRRGTDLMSVVGSFVLRQRPTTKNNDERPTCAENSPGMTPTRLEFCFRKNIRISIRWQCDSPSSTAM